MDTATNTAKYKSKKILSLANKYKFTILFFSYLSVIALSLSSGFNIHKLLCVFSFFFVLHIFSKLPAVFRITFSILLALLISFDAYFAFEYGSLISYSIMGSIFQTTKYEVISLLPTLLIKGIIIFAITLSLILLAENELKKTNLKIKYSVLILALYLIYVPVYINYYCNKKFTEEYGIDPLFTIYSKSRARYPIIYATLLTVEIYRREHARIQAFLNLKKNLPEGIQLIDNAHTPQKVFIVIGESSNRLHYSLYGYKIETTPFLDSLKLNNSSFRFYNGITSAPTTKEAIPLALSFASVSKKDNLYIYKNILDMAKDAGYETLWISNQDKSGPYEGQITVISSTADLQFFPDKWPRFDINLIPEVKSRIVPGKKQMFFVHLFGSHLNYNHRYLKPDAEAIPGSGIVTDYDRSIYHTDRTLRELYHLLMEGDTPACLYYFPDHSEIVGLGHGINQERHEQYDIPILTFNNKFNKIDTIVSQYINPTYKYVNNSNTVNILAEIIGYKTTEKLKQQAMEDSEYCLSVELIPMPVKDILPQY